MHARRQREQASAPIHPPAPRAQLPRTAPAPADKAMRGDLLRRWPAGVRAGLFPACSSAPPADEVRRAGRPVPGRHERLRREISRDGELMGRGCLKGRRIVGGDWKN